MGGVQGVRSADPDDVPQINVKKMMLQSCAACCSAPIGLALFIIGVCAAAGTMSGIVAGGCAIGLSVPLLLIAVINGRKDFMGNDRTFDMVTGIISCLAYIVFGALAITGVFPAASVGYAILGVSAIQLIISCVRMYCFGGFQQAMGMVSLMQNANA